MWVIMTVDATDEFNERLDFENGSLNLHDVTFYNEWDEAKAKFNEIKGHISNVYLMKIIDEEVYI